jgi:hypothetical protein
MPFPLRCVPAVSLLACAAPCATAAELYGGGGTSGFELGLSQPLADSVGLRVEANSLNITRDFDTSGVRYDARLKFGNAGVYLDGFVGGSFRLTAGALIGSRKIHGTARSVGNTITLNGVTYTLAAGDTLDFDARFPTVTPYLGIGWGHRGDAPGLGFYADAGAAIGRADVTLSPSPSLAAKVNTADLAAEQRNAQDKANDWRVFPVVKLGMRYRF